MRRWPTLWKASGASASRSFARRGRGSCSAATTSAPQAGAYSNGATSSQNGPYTDTFALDVTHAADDSAALTFNYGSGATCTLSGALAQFGQLYDMPGARRRASARTARRDAADRAANCRRRRLAVKLQYVVTVHSD
jgi:hypothetical protein